MNKYYGKNAKYMRKYRKHPDKNSISILGMFKDL